MASFSSRIEQYTGSNTNLDVTNALKQAVDNTLGVVKSRAPQLLSLFARKMSIIGDVKYNLSSKNVFDVSKVEREDGTNTYVCQPVPAEQLYSVGDASSIYYAQVYSPVYTIDFESNLTIKPSATATDKAYMYLVYNSDSKIIDDSVGTITDVSETITQDGASVSDPYTASVHFPDVWQQYVVLSASSILVQEKISLLLSDAGLDSITSIEEWLADEDEGMVSSTGQAVNLFQGKLSIIDKYKQEFLMSQGIGGTSDDPRQGQKS